jgi:hypothetical protein
MSAQWRQWRAWYPVRIDGRWHWLIVVECREMHIGELVPQWVYRLPQR